MCVLVSMCCVCTCRYGTCLSVLVCDVQVRTCAGMGITGRCVCTFAVLVSRGTGVCTQVVVCVHLCNCALDVGVLCSLGGVWLAVFARLSVCLLTHIACVFLRDGLWTQALHAALGCVGAWALVPPGWSTARPTWVGAVSVDPISVLGARVSAWPAVQGPRVCEDPVGP